MYINYVRQLLRAEDGLTEKEKVRIAEKIEKWATKHNVQNIGRVHEVLDLWIDRKLNWRDRLVARLDRPDEEGVGVVDLVENPKAQNPAEIVIADGEFRYASYNETHEYVTDNLEGDARELFVEILNQNPDGKYRVDADDQNIVEWATIIHPRIKNGKILIPKKVASIGFRNGKLEIKYCQGYSDDKVNQALFWYSRGLHPGQVAKKINVPEGTLYKWLYMRMDLPRIGTENIMRNCNIRARKILKLYDDGLRPMEITEMLDYSPETVYKVLKNFKGLNFGWGGPDPWEYEFTGKVKTLCELRNLDLERKKRTGGGKWIYDCRERYELIFKYVREFCRQKNRGPTEDEVKEALGFKIWYYLQEMVGFGILDKKKIPKEKIYTPYFI